MLNARRNIRIILMPTDGKQKKSSFSWGDKLPLECQSLWLCFGPESIVYVERQRSWFNVEVGIVDPGLLRAYYSWILPIWFTREAIACKSPTHINAGSTWCRYQVNQSFDGNDGSTKATAAGPGSLRSCPFEASKPSFTSVPKVVRGDIPLRCRPVVSFEIGPYDH